MFVEYSYTVLLKCLFLVVACVSNEEDCSIENIIHMNVPIALSTVTGQMDRWTDGQMDKASSRPLLQIKTLLPKWLEPPERDFVLWKTIQ